MPDGCLLIDSMKAHVHPLFTRESVKHPTPHVVGPAISVVQNLQSPALESVVWRTQRPHWREEGLRHIAQTTNTTKYHSGPAWPAWYRCEKNLLVHILRNMWRPHPSMGGPVWVLTCDLSLVTALRSVLRGFMIPIIHNLAWNTTTSLTLVRIMIVTHHFLVVNRIVNPYTLRPKRNMIVISMLVPKWMLHIVFW